MKLENPDKDLSVNKPEWDYTVNAPYYKYRPNYAPEAIDEMLTYVKARGSSDYVVADIGAGTGNLTMMLSQRGLNVIAVEPNAGMRNIGMGQVQSANVQWRTGTGEETGLAEQSVDVFAMGSSFNTTDRLATLTEADRVLKPGGFFVCMWNHRDLNDETQKKSEEILKEFFSDYSHGTRRENQSDLLNASTLFKNLHFIEKTQEIRQKTDDYIAAWKSVKNKFWDLANKEGQVLFGKIEQRMRAELPAVQVLHYTTRIWIVQKI